MAHLDERHKDEIADRTFQRVMAKSTIRTFGITNCPLCNDSGPTDSPEIIEHVLGHVYDFSMHALPWRTLPVNDFDKPIRTFNDVAPTCNSNEKKEVVEMRQHSHARMLHWVCEPHPEEGWPTLEKSARIRDLDWDDYRAVVDKFEASSVSADYYDRPGVDYFNDENSSHGAACRTDQSIRTSRSSMKSGALSTYSAQDQDEPSLPVQDTDGLQPLSVDFIENRRAGGEPEVNFDPSAQRSVTLPVDSDIAMLDHGDEELQESKLQAKATEESFAAALVALKRKKKNTNDPKIEDFDLDACHDWTEITNAIHGVVENYHNDDTTWGRIQTGFRRVGDNAKSLQSFVGLLPDGAFETLCGGLVLILTVSDLHIIVQDVRS
ncbi:uncharacterized protein J4E79_007723 [Alternaria viburni]|uniref:uncharacterized protein n=1 Tax=Alternaria viburni TaxID=566460 RepID=UPI0020C43790|nr:uncharacterized protein J4E79_007723 [Alternaria viburni]KAI4657107.1 hypothetical protein J4E79_007723 [Alternaria viburni]